MPLLFSYGTLQQDAVQRSTFGRSLRGEPDELVGFERALFRVDDAAFVAASGREHHAIVRRTGDARSRVPGTVLELTDAELAAADAYEPAGYVRVAATLASGREAWVYADAAHAARPSGRERPVAPDRAAHRAWLAALARVPAGGTVVDLGCGRGEDLLLLADRHPDALHLVGVDTSDASLAAAAESAARHPRLSFRRAALDGPLPFADASVDVVYSHNLLECLADAEAFAHEVARVLRPGGQAVIAHWDWDSQLFDGADRARVRRLVHAFADWQQAWMAHADGWMGRRLHGVLDATGRFAGEVHARVLTNTAFEPPWFGHENALAMRGLVKRGLASAEDCDAFLDEQRELHARGRYFYAITGFAYVGVRARQPT